MFPFYWSQQYRQTLSYNLKPKKKKPKMHQFLTPLKQKNQTGKNQPKAQSQPRQGDWICYNCSNLNFSFRKKCNRCKVQTREQNEELSHYYYNCFPQDGYLHHEKQNFPTLQNHSFECPPSTQKTQSRVPTKIDIPKPELRWEGTPSLHCQREQLPSVSPLVKRYNRHERSTQESKSKGLFEDDGLWVNINLNYLDQPFQSGVKGRKEDNGEIPEQIEEMQKIIRRIIL